MLDGKELEQAIAAMPGEKVEMQDILRRIKDKTFMTLGEIGCPTVTVCNIILDNGYSVRGESACVDPENFSEEIGKSLAYKQAFDRLWPLFGFLLAEKRHMRSSVMGLLFMLLFAGCSTLFPVEETKYLHFENGEQLRIDRQHGKAFDTRKVYEIQGTDKKVWGHWVCTTLPSTDTEHCTVRKLQS